jgi:rubredoxin
MPGSNQKFTRTGGTCECPLCGHQRRFWRRDGHNPAWLFRCSRCGLRFYGTQPRDLYKFFRITRRAMEQREVV